MATIRDYTVTLYSAGIASVKRDSTSLSAYRKIPTLEELSAVLEEEITQIRLYQGFYNCGNIISSPNISGGSVSDFSYIFSGCSSLVIPPALPKAENGSRSFSFHSCSSMLVPPVIPAGSGSLWGFFRHCYALRYPASIPKDPNGSSFTVKDMYRNCTNMTGEMIIRPAAFSDTADMFTDTVEPITLYGDQALCETLAATANNGNASWSPWYDPVPAVTDRGQGSYTTAADMTRMVRNGALAVDTYAPARMVYQQGDIVREDEWKALVEAAKTIDPTITYSTIYTNLNKIEAAFDSAL